MSDGLVNKDKVTILKGDPVTDFWLEGAVNRYPGYTFQVKVYDVGSVFGIEQGRISISSDWNSRSTLLSRIRRVDHIQLVKSYFRWAVKAYGNNGRTRAATDV
jgi:hypothetical protein